MRCPSAGWRRVMCREDNGRDLLVLLFLLDVPGGEPKAFRHHALLGAHSGAAWARLKKQKKIIKGIGILGFLEIPDTHCKGGFYKWRYSK